MIIKASQTNFQDESSDYTEPKELVKIQIRTVKFKNFYIFTVQQWY